MTRDSSKTNLKLSPLPTIMRSIETKPTIEITSATIAKQKVNDKIKQLVLNTSQVEEEDSYLDQSIVQTNLPSISSHGRKFPPTQFSQQVRNLLRSNLGKGNPQTTMNIVDQSMGHS